MDIDINKQLERFQNTKGPWHENAAMVERIKEEIGFQGRYGWGYWAKKVERISYAKLNELLKEAEELNKYFLSVGEKFNKGAWLTNKLKDV